MRLRLLLHIPTSKRVQILPSRLARCDNFLEGAIWLTPGEVLGARRVQRPAKPRRA